MKPIAATTHRGNAVIICDDGSIFRLDDACKVWKQLPIPQLMAIEKSHEVLSTRKRSPLRSVTGNRSAKV